MRTQFLASFDLGSSDQELPSFASVRPVRRQLPWAIRQKNLAARLVQRRTLHASSDGASSLSASESSAGEAQLHADRAYILGDHFVDLDLHAEYGPDTQSDDDDAGWF